MPTQIHLALIGETRNAYLKRTTPDATLKVGDEYCLPFGDGPNDILLCMIVESTQTLGHPDVAKLEAQILDDAADTALCGLVQRGWVRDAQPEDPPLKRSKG